MDNAAIEEMFSALGPVTVKRMFGGKDLFRGPDSGAGGKWRHSVEGRRRECGRV